jgi:hypothetical protein
MNMHFGTRLDLTNVQPAGEYLPVPEGIYKVICHEFEVVQKENFTGGKVKFTIVEGEHANRKVNDFFILTHSTSQQAQDIGQRRLRAWCDALGVSPNIESAEPLIHKPLMAKIKVEKPRTVGDKEYGAQNRIETFMPADSASAATPAAAPVLRPAVASVPAAKPAAAAQAALATTPAASAPKAMPWKR